VLERAVLAEPGAHDEAIHSLRSGLELRVVEELPLKLVLADSDLALVPLVTTTDAEPGAVLLQRSGLVDALDALFESTWQRAYPLGLSSFEDDAVPDDGSGERLSLLERQILSLLLAGLSDQAVATQLGLSLRTLQRHLRRLQDAAGVNTRMQLGWYAARNGWA